MVLAVELIDAKQSLAGDLCPLRPCGHYLVTNGAQGRLKLPTVLLDKSSTDDETTAEAMQSSNVPQP